MARAIFIVFLFPVAAEAVTCREYIPPDQEAILVESEEGSIAISLPAKLDGQDLFVLLIFVYPVIDGEEEELSASLAFEIDNSTATSGFFLSSKWAEIQIHAAYGESICGPRLNYSQAI